MNIKRQPLAYGKRLVARLSADWWVEINTASEPPNAEPHARWGEEGERKSRSHPIYSFFATEIKFSQAPEGCHISDIGNCDSGSDICKTQLLYR